MRRGKGRSFVGFLLTYFLTSILICTCILVSLKSTVLKGNGIKEFIKSLDIGEYVEEVVNDDVSVDCGGGAVATVTSVVVVVVVTCGDAFNAFVS